MPVEDVIREFNSNLKPKAESKWLDEARSDAWCSHLPAAKLVLHDQARFESLSQHSEPSATSSLLCNGVAFGTTLLSNTSRISRQGNFDAHSTGGHLARSSVGAIAAVGASAFISNQLDKYIFTEARRNSATFYSDLTIPFVALIPVGLIPKALSMVAVHSVGRMLDSRAEDPLKAMADWFKTCVSMAEIEKNRKADLLRPELNAAFEKDANERTKQSLTESLSVAGKMVSIDSDSVRNELLQKKPCTVVQERAAGAMAIAYADTLSSSVVLPSGKTLRFHCNLDFGGNAARFYNLAERNLRSSVGHGDFYETRQSPAHAAAERVVDEVINERITAKIRSTYVRDSDLKMAYDTLRQALRTDREDVEALADGLAVEVSKHKVSLLSQEGLSEPLHLQLTWESRRTFLKKLAMDGALVRFALCETDLEGGNLKQAAQHYRLARRLQEISANFGSRVNLLFSLQENLGFRLQSHLSPSEWQLSGWERKPNK